MKTLGYDVGGMSVKIGIMEENKILYRTSLPTDVEKDTAEFIRDMAMCALKLMQDNHVDISEICGIGIGIPGIEDRNGFVYCVNLFWNGVPLRSELQKWIDKPVFITNDANVAALAEHTVGVCKGASISLTVTLGTGIGGGIIINDRILEGAHGLGGEIGHIPLVMDGRRCTCNIPGCFERYASAAAFNRMTQQAVRKYPDSLLGRRAKEGAEITAKLTIDCMLEGDSVSKAVFDRYIHCLAMGLAGLINIFDPDVIAVGGGLSAAKDVLLLPLCEEVEKLRIFNTLPGTQIKLATMGNDAGLIGAHIYCLQGLYK